MKLKIAGSGGMFQIPNPFCSCPLCREAREKRGRYRRCGPALYIEDIAMLIDAPEDIGVACERQGISQVRTLAVSHNHPDHCRGMRIVEALGFDAITEKACPVEFVALPEVIEDLNAWNGGALEYYASALGCIRLNATDCFRDGSVTVHLVNNRTRFGNMTFYVLQEGDKKAVYAPCDVRPFVHSDLYRGADVLILGLVSDDGVLRDGSRLEDAPFRDDMYTLEEAVEIRDRYGIATLVVTHIDEYWGKSYGYYLELEKRLDGVQFAFDGMEITL